MNDMLILQIIRLKEGFLKRRYTLFYRNSEQMAVILATLITRNPYLVAIANGVVEPPQRSKEYNFNHSVKSSQANYPNL